MVKTVADAGSDLSCPVRIIGYQTPLGNSDPGAKRLAPDAVSEFRG